MGFPSSTCRTFSTASIRVPGASAASERGLGLGLSFVDWIVRAHIGRIEVSSEPGRGTKFVVRLPRKEIRSTLFS